MNVKGMMIGVRRYQFTDKETGELVRGAKVQVGVSPEDDNTAGFVVQDIRPLLTFTLLSQLLLSSLPVSKSRWFVM